MTDIARARAILTAVHENATPGPWRAISFGHGGSFTQIIQPAEFQPGYDASRFDNLDLDIADIRESAADAEFITLMVDLYPAIDGLLEAAIVNYDDIESSMAVWHAEAFAAAILAWAERTGYEA